MSTLLIHADDLREGLTLPHRLPSLPSSLSLSSPTALLIAMYSSVRSDLTPAGWKPSLYGCPTVLVASECTPVCAELDLDRLCEDAPAPAPKLPVRMCGVDPVRTWCGFRCEGPCRAAGVPEKEVRDTVCRVGCDDDGDGDRDVCVGTLFVVTALGGVSPGVGGEVVLFGDDAPPSRAILAG